MTCTRQMFDRHAALKNAPLVIALPLLTLNAQQVVLRTVGQSRLGAGFDVLLALLLLR